MSSDALPRTTLPLKVAVPEPVIAATVVAPVTPKVPVTAAFPATVALSAIVVSEVECPIVTAIPLVSVASFKAPVALVT